MSDFEFFSDSSDGSDAFVQPLKNDVYLEYKVHSPADLAQQQKSIISQISGVLGITDTEALACLVYYNWNKDILLENYLVNPTNTRNTVGLTSAVTDVEAGPINCDICYDTCNLSLALECGHRYCLDCWKEYLNRKIREEGESRKIQCPGSCTLTIDESTIYKIVDQNLKDWYLWNLIYIGIINY